MRIVGIVIAVPEDKDKIVLLRPPSLQRITLFIYFGIDRQNRLKIKR